MASLPQTNCIVATSILAGLCYAVLKFTKEIIKMKHPSKNEKVARQDNLLKITDTTASNISSDHSSIVRAFQVRSIANRHSISLPYAKLVCSLQNYGSAA